MTVARGARLDGVVIRIAAALVVASALLGGCSSSAREPGGTVEVWRSGDQYVRLEPPKVLVNGERPRNAHPVRISAAHLGNALALVQVKDSRRDPPRPLFAPASLEVLSRGLEAGLARARPDQDVTFAVEQRTPGVLGLADTRVVSGRVFFAGGWLNLIFGAVLGYDVAEDDVLFDSYAPGRRDVRVAGQVLLFAAPGSGVYRAPGVDRPDWLMFGPRALAVAAPPQPYLPQPYPVQPSPPRPAPSPAPWPR